MHSFNSIGLYLKYYDYYYNGNLLDLPTQEASNYNDAFYNIYSYQSYYFFKFILNFYV